jgi:GTP-binding protein HflX
LGGGIGTRGPGETKLEVDRRRIDDRIAFLKKRLEKLHQRKEVQRKERKDPKVQHVAIVGYTNVGKSTLLNALTDAGVLAEDKLFATLDTTTRKLVLPCGRHVVLTDTVGFIRRLPHEIVEAFQSTFQEARDADLILHLVDASGPDSLSELRVGNAILESMGVKDAAKLFVLTKKDLCPTVGILSKAPAPHVAVSSQTGEGLDILLEMISELLERDFEHVFMRFPPGSAQHLYQVRKHGHILEESADDADMEIEALIPHWLHGMLHKYVVPERSDYQLKNF